MKEHVLTCIGMDPIAWSMIMILHLDKTVAVQCGASCTSSRDVPIIERGQDTEPSLADGRDRPCHAFLSTSADLTGEVLG